jgi:AraC-like DNA-binding protein
MDCVNDVRHQLALRYLATTNFTVEVIAERLGYSDTANFRHAFRRWTGVSPRAYVARASADLPVTVMRTHREEATFTATMQ